MIIKPKALYICSHIPSQYAYQAGHKTAYYNLKKLAESYITDILLLIRNDVPLSEEEINGLAELGCSIHIVRISKFDRYIYGFLGLFNGIAPQFATRISRNVSSIIYNLNNKNIYTQVWLEFSQTFWVTKFFDNKTKIILSSHDLQTVLLSSKSSSFMKFFLGLTFITEKKLLSRANEIIVQSNNDVFFIENYFKINASKINLIQPKLSNFLTMIKRTNTSIEKYSLLFWGAMSRIENYSAAINFIENSFPLVKAIFPLTKLYIIGSNPPSNLIKLSSESIIVTGYVEDPSAYFERASIGIAPLLEGAGIKVKVLEMLEVGLYTIATPVAAEGIVTNSNLKVCEMNSFHIEICNYWNVMVEK